MVLLNERSVNFLKLNYLKKLAILKNVVYFFLLNLWNTVQKTRRLKITIYLKTPSSY